MKTVWIFVRKHADVLISIESEGVIDTAIATEAEQITPMREAVERAMGQDYRILRYKFDANATGGDPNG